MAITGILNNTLKNIQTYIFSGTLLQDETPEIINKNWMLSIDRMIDALCAQEPNYDQ